MKKSRFLAFLLTIVMIFSGLIKISSSNKTLISSAQSYTELEGKVVGNKKVFNLTKNLEKVATESTRLIGKSKNEIEMQKSNTNNISMSSTKSPNPLDGVDSLDPGKEVEEPTLIDKNTGAEELPSQGQDLLEDSSKDTQDQAEPELELSPEPTIDNLMQAQNEEVPVNTTIDLVTVGLENNTKPFDRTVFKNSTFSVSFIYTDTYGDPIWIDHPGVDFTQGQARKETYVDWPVGVDVEGLSIAVDFDGDYDVRAEATNSGTNSEGGTVVNFKLIVTEVPNTDLLVKYQDIYGRDLSDEYKPDASVKMPTYHIDILNGVDITLPKDNFSVNLRNFDGEGGLLDKVDEGMLTEDELDSIIDNIDVISLNSLSTIPLTINGKSSGNLSFNGKDYSFIAGQTSKKDPLSIRLTYLADVVIPPRNDDGSPVPTPSGYQRVTFDAGDGDFGNGNLDKFRYFDVKDGLTWKDAKEASPTKLEVPKAFGPDGKTFVGWDPVLPDDTARVGTYTYKANYQDYCSALEVKSSSQEYEEKRDGQNIDRKYIKGQVAYPGGQESENIAETLNVLIVDKDGNFFKDQDDNDIEVRTQVKEDGTFEFEIDDTFPFKHGDTLYFAVECLDSGSEKPKGQAPLTLDLKGPAITWS